MYFGITVSYEAQTPDTGTKCRHR